MALCPSVSIQISDGCQSCEQFCEGAIHNRESDVQARSYPTAGLAPGPTLLKRPNACLSVDAIFAEPLDKAKMVGRGVDVSAVSQDARPAPALGPTDVGESALQTSDAMSESENDLFYFSWYLMLCLGLVHFGLVPIAYQLGKSGQLHAGFCLMGFEFIFIYFIQLVWERRILLFSKQPWCSREHEIALEPFTASRKLLGIPLIHFQMKRLYLGIIEFTDPTSDGLNTGRAQCIPTQHQLVTEMFAKSWRGRLWGLGDEIANLGLPGVLLMLLVFAALSQCVALLVVLYLLHVGRYNRTQRFHLLMIAADIISLAIVGEVCSRLYHATNKQYIMCGRALAKCVTHFLLENGFAMWFGSSLFALTYDSSDALGRTTSFFAVATSVCTAGHIWAQTLGEARHWWTASSAWNSSVKPPCRKGAVVMLYLPALVLTGFIIICTGLKCAGVWLCSSRVISLSDLSCMGIH